MMKEHEQPLLQQASELIECERAQIGHEIHDGLLPLIFAASATIHSVLPEQAGQDDSETPPLPDATLQKLRTAGTWLEDALKSGRQLLTQVYPPELTGTLWSRAARDAVERSAREPETSVTWQLDDDVDHVSPPVAVAAYRIVTEAVRNAVAHGKASQITIQGQQNDQQIRVTIQDNGTGFDPDTVAADRFGIRSMKGRAKLVGGALVLTSALGEGTTLTLTLPANEGA